MNDASSSDELSLEISNDNEESDREFNQHVLFKQFKKSLVFLENPETAIIPKLVKKHIKYLHLRNLSGNTDWLCDLVKSCSALKMLVIEDFIPIWQFSSLLSVINMHPNLIYLHITDDANCQYIRNHKAYDPIWEQFILNNHSLLYSKFQFKSTNKTKQLREIINTTDGKNALHLKQDSKLSLVHFNWLNFKYPNQAFWHQALDDRCLLISSILVSEVLNIQRSMIPLDIVKNIIRHLNADFKLDCLKNFLRSKPINSQSDDTILQINNNYTFVSELQSEQESRVRLKALALVALITLPLFIGMYGATIFNSGFQHLHTGAMAVILTALPICYIVGLCALATNQGPLSKCIKSHYAAQKTFEHTIDI